MALPRLRITIRLLVVAVAIVAVAITAIQKCRRLSETRRTLAQEYAAKEAGFKGHLPLHSRELAYLRSLRARDPEEMRATWAMQPAWLRLDARALIAEAEAEQGVPIVSSTDARAAYERQVAKHRAQDKVDLARKVAECEEAIEREAKREQSDALKAAYFAQLKLKYGRAATLPWLPVAPDLPEPEIAGSEPCRPEIWASWRVPRPYLGFVPRPPTWSRKQRLQRANSTPNP